MLTKDKRLDKPVPVKGACATIDPLKQGRSEQGQKIVEDIIKLPEQIKKALDGYTNIKNIEDVLNQMTRLEAAMGETGQVYFLRVYYEMTNQLNKNKAEFRDKWEWVEASIVRFALLYFERLENYGRESLGIEITDGLSSKKPSLPECWRRAFTLGSLSRRNPSFFMSLRATLAGINAHLIYDLPCALRDMHHNSKWAGFYDENQEQSFRQAFDKVNEVIDRGSFEIAAAAFSKPLYKGLVKLVKPFITLLFVRQRSMVWGDGRQLSSYQQKDATTKDDITIVAELYEGGLDYKSCDYLNDLIEFVPLTLITSNALLHGVPFLRNDNDPVFDERLIFQLHDPALTQQLYRTVEHQWYNRLGRLLRRTALIHGIQLFFQKNKRYKIPIIILTTLVVLGGEFWLWYNFQWWALAINLVFILLCLYILALLSKPR